MSNLHGPATGPNGSPDLDDRGLDQVDAWDEEEMEEEAVLQTDESAAFFGSMAVHILVIAALAIMPTQVFKDEQAVVIVSPPVENESDPVIEEVVYSDIPEIDIGSNSTAESEMADASAEMFAEVAVIPSPVELEKSDLGDIEVNRIFSQPMAPTDRLTNRKGTVGEGTTGGSFLYTWTDNQADSTDISASYDSESWALNGTLTSYHLTGNWTLAPSIGVSLNEESDEAYTDSSAVPTSFAASTTRTGTLAFGGSATYTHTLENGTTIEPALSVEGEWTFLRDVTATSSVSADTQDLDVNMTGSVDFQLSQSTSLSLSSTVSGLAKPDYLSVIGGGRLSISF